MLEIDPSLPLDEDQRKVLYKLICGHQKKENPSPRVAAGEHTVEMGGEHATLEKSETVRLKYPLLLETVAGEARYHVCRGALRGTGSNSEVHEQTIYFTLDAPNSVVIAIPEVSLKKTRKFSKKQLQEQFIAASRKPRQSPPSSTSSTAADQAQDVVAAKTQGGASSSSTSSKVIVPASVQLFQLRLQAMNDELNLSRRVVPGLGDLITEQYKVAGENCYEVHQFMTDLGITLERYFKTDEYLNSTTKERLHEIFRLLHSVNYMHSCDVLNGDLKPDNVIRTRDGKYIVIDFDCGLRVSDKRPARQANLYSRSPEAHLDEVATPLSDGYGLAPIIAEFLGADMNVLLKARRASLATLRENAGSLLGAIELHEGYDFNSLPSLDGQHKADRSLLIRCLRMMTDTERSFRLSPQAAEVFIAYLLGDWSLFEKHWPEIEKNWKKNLKGVEGFEEALSLQEARFYWNFFAYLRQAITTQTEQEIVKLTRHFILNFPTQKKIFAQVQDELNRLDSTAEAHDVNEKFWPLINELIGSAALQPDHEYVHIALLHKTTLQKWDETADTKLRQSLALRLARTSNLYDPRHARWRQSLRTLTAEAQVLPVANLATAKDFELRRLHALLWTQFQIEPRAPGPKVGRKQQNSQQIRALFPDGRMLDVQPDHSLLRVESLDTKTEKAFVVISRNKLGSGKFGRVKNVGDDIVYIGESGHRLEKFSKRMVIKIIRKEFSKNDLDAQEDFKRLLNNEAGLTKKVYPETTSVVFREINKVDKTTLVAYFLMPFLGVSLSELLSSPDWKKTTESERWKLCASLMKALQNIGALGIVHRDISINNLLYDNNNGTISNGTISISDFGLAKLAVWEVPEYCGNLFTVSPEAFVGRTTSASDVYAAGSVIAELLGADASTLLRNRNVFVGQMQYDYDFTSIPLPPERKPYAIRLCQRMTHLNPAARPTAAVVYEATHLLTEDSLFWTLTDVVKTNGLPASATSKFVALKQFINVTLFEPDKHLPLLRALQLLVDERHPLASLIHCVPGTDRVAVDRQLHRFLINALPAEHRSEQAKALLAMTDQDELSLSSQLRADQLKPLLQQVGVGLEKYRTLVSSRWNSLSHALGSDTGVVRAVCYRAVLQNDQIDPAIRWLFLATLLKHDKAARLRDAVVEAIPNARGCKELSTAVDLQLFGLFAVRTEDLVRARSAIHKTCDEGRLDATLNLATQLESELKPRLSENLNH